MKPLHIPPHEQQYAGMIGTGGLGTGKFFHLNGNHTLGREESRSGRFLDVEDYCKQHIILHYVKVLAGPQFSVTPIGKVGEDDLGHTLLREMNATGFVMDHVQTQHAASTLFSLCFYYPDGSGGNLTTDNSASAQVTAEDIARASSEINALGSRGIVMAAPEVPLAARAKLLMLGKAAGACCAASFTAEELRQPETHTMLSSTDLLSINLSEAHALIPGHEHANTKDVVERTIQTLREANPHMLVAITDGRMGSWCWDGHTLNFRKSIDTVPRSTAGAGDAFFSGLLCGQIAGLSFFEAQELATLVAALSVTSQHTIHKTLDRCALKEFYQHTATALSLAVKKLLED
ncbi:carbohydrate kinase family protein [Chryseolinea lacunae]|uniref:Carbohydrate kinase family protein n=1 Tax=Chryseolinea lacunae TaxID=2801331 RepID=A0ABS1L1A7_9BACT|nr:carbohydrate kinase family protein [Chryseolinea lacunae]MBL0745307.1 carbohydrate kinase family protein [Chryseolinea lacunae]